MTYPYLIAHKVRGEPAFDVALRMTCPHCDKGKLSAEGTFEDEDCHECDGLGYWWIIPTSGHRAYPWWNLPLRYLIGDEIHGVIEGPCPPNLPDHYTTRAAPTVDLAEALGLTLRKTPPAPIKRRF